MAINILSSANSLLQRFFGDKIRLGDTPETELQTETQVDTRIDTKVPIADSNQIKKVGNTARISTLYTKSTGFTVTFTAWTEHGSKSAPIYEKLSVDRTNANDETRCKVYHSGLLVPTIFIPQKPESLLPTYDSQALMTADFANQSIGQHYYFTGSTSAWLYNGGGTDDIANYTEVPEIPGWQTWGEKPDWLILTGSNYLVGRDNINQLTFTFHSLYDTGTGEPLEDVVVCEILPKVNGNNQLVKPYPSVIKMRFNENVSPVLFDSLINDSDFSHLFEPIIVGVPSESTYELLSGNNYAMTFGTTTDSTNSKGRIEMNINDYAKSLFVDKLTVIARFAMVPSPVAATPIRRTFFSNYIASPIFRGAALSTNDTPSLGFRLQAGSGTGMATYSFNTPIPLLEDGTYWTVIGTYDFVDGGAGGLVLKCYVKSNDNAIPFQLLGTQSTQTPRYLSGGSSLIHLSRREPLVSMQPVKLDYIEVMPIVLTDAEAEAIANQLEP